MGSSASGSEIGRMLYSIHMVSKTLTSLMHIREDTKNCKELTRRIY